MNADQAAEVLGVSRRQVYALAAPGGPIPCTRIGKRIKRPFGRSLSKKLPRAPNAAESIKMTEEATIKPCAECGHFDPSDGMCCRPFVVAGMVVKRAPPMRKILWVGEDQCGKDGRWFEPIGTTHGR